MTKPGHQSRIHPFRRSPLNRFNDMSSTQENSKGAEPPEEHGPLDLESPSWEEEATRLFGPPEERRRKNLRHVQKLMRLVSESDLRNILKALSRMDEPVCCANLRKHDLDHIPLHEVIQPYELLGFRFHLSGLSSNQVTAQVGESFMMVGSGGTFVLERQEDGDFRVTETGTLWIA